MKERPTEEQHLMFLKCRRVSAARVPVSERLVTLTIGPSGSNGRPADDSKLELKLFRLASIYIK